MSANDITGAEWHLQKAAELIAGPGTADDAGLAVVHALMAIGLLLEDISFTLASGLTVRVK